MKFKDRSFISLLFVLTNLALLSGSLLAETKPLHLSKGWAYRWGDSPVDTGGAFVWMQADDTTKWQQLDNLQALAVTGKHQYIWYRIKLPNAEITNPALFIPMILTAFEVYQDGAQIYRHGPFAPNNQAKADYLKGEIIPLPIDFQGKILFIRVYSPKPQFIGIYEYPNGIFLGRESEIIKTVIVQNIDSILLGFLFITVGLFAIFVFFRRYRERPYYVVSFGSAVFFIGMYLVMFDRATQMVMDNPMLGYYLGFVAFVSFPIGLYSFQEQILAPAKLIRRIWQLHLFLAICIILLDSFDIMIFAELQQIYLIIFISTILISLATGIYKSIKGVREARLFVIGFSLMGLFGIHDILMGFNIIPQWRWMVHYGTFIFIIILAYLLEQKFSETRKKLVRYSEELEVKSAELEEYSQTLEEKVEQRTSELNQKNRELEHTLKELRETQNQLIIKEKMASLGNLVAGVAHEVNNPVGAMNSAASVLTKGLAKIKTILQQTTSIRELRKDQKFHKTVDLLTDNSKVIVTGSERVAKIVRSLRTFARLDEAEFQDSDILEGLDSTLTLLQHELKNKVEVIKEYGQIPRVECYPNQLNQVFLNILANAAQAIEQKGTIRITTKADDRHVYIDFSDDGKGIPAEHIGKIFDPGFTTKGVGVGTGLGLSISYNIIEKHHGKMSVQSVPGQGTTFHLKLPIFQAQFDSDLEKRIKIKG